MTDLYCIHFLRVIHLSVDIAETPGISNTFLCPTPNFNSSITATPICQVFPSILDAPVPFLHCAMCVVTLVNVLDPSTINMYSP